MSALMKHHREVDEQGEGKCSVPMWMAGSPCGFCDEPAYGERPIGETFRLPNGEERRYDGRYGGYVPGLACAGHGGPDSRVFKDGSAWCAVRPDFQDLQASPAGFGDTPAQARVNLAVEEAKQGGQS